MPIMAPSLDVNVSHPTPYTFDLGLLLAQDPNPLPPASTDVSLEERLSSTARDGAQALINQLLTTCPIQSEAAGVLMKLPAPETPLPREKPLPAAKEKSKWSQFAEKKGIKPKTREQRRDKSQQFNEHTGEWEKTWGYKSKRKEGVVQDDWIVEVDNKGETKGRAAADKTKAKKKREA